MENDWGYAIQQELEDLADGNFFNCASLHTGARLHTFHKFFSNYFHLLQYCFPIILSTMEATYIFCIPYEKQSNLFSFLSDKKRQTIYSKITDLLSLVITI